MTDKTNPRAAMDAALWGMRYAKRTSGHPGHITMEATVACAEALSLLVDAHLPEPDPLPAPTEEHMARVAAPDEAARLPDEPPVGSLVRDRDGDEWFRNVDGWLSPHNGLGWGWAELNDACGPVTVIHRTAS